MSIGDQLRSRRMELKLSRNQLAEKIQVTPSAIANYENGISYPKPAILLSLMLALKVDANYLFQDYLDDQMISRPCGDHLTSDEKNALMKYRHLTEHGKYLVRMVIDDEYARIQKNQCTTLPCYQSGMRKLHSGFIMSENPRNIQVPAEYLPLGTDFCFQIQIDGYEPIFQKYDVIALSYCPAEHNEMGIFYLNGICYIRTLFRNQDICRLCSLNVIDPVIEVSQKDDFHCVGKILGKVYGGFDIF